MLAGTCEHVVDRPEVEDPKPLGPVKVSFEAFARDCLRSVEQRARYRGRREALPGDLVLGGESWKVVKVDPLSVMSARRHRNIDGRGKRGLQSPEPCGGVVAEQGPCPTGKQSRVAAAVGRKPFVADGIHPTMNSVQSPRCKGAIDCTGRVPEHAHLLSRDHAVLSFRYAGQPVMRSLLSAHTEDKCERPTISPPVEADSRICSQFPSH